MKDPLQPVDLRQSVRRGLAHICASVDRQRDCRPYFRFNLKEPPVWAQHEAGDTPHTVGRFLHALDVCAEITGLPDDPELLRGLRAQLFASCDRGAGFGWDDTGDPLLAYMHHQREVLLGLLALWRLNQDLRAKRYAQALVTAMEQATRVLGTYPGRRLGPQGWQEPDQRPTSTSGRAISALLAFARSFDDPRLVVALAERFARHVLAVSFGEQGVFDRGSGSACPLDHRYCRLARRARTSDWPAGAMSSVPVRSLMSASCPIAPGPAGSRRARPPPMGGEKPTAPRT